MPQCLFQVITYEINICSVRTDEWHSKRIKFEASKRHSGECFFEVNSMITGIPLSLPSVWHTVIEINKKYPIKQKLSRKPISAVTNYVIRDEFRKWAMKGSDFTALTIWSNLNATSRDIRLSSTSMIASIPCAETSCDCISGVSTIILSYI